jgi:hypothetical protein
MNFEELDMNIDNYDLNDLLSLFNLDYNFTEDELKRAKKIVLMLHPDKCSLDKEYFLFFTSAYKVLYSVYNFRNTKTTSTQYYVEKDEQKELVLEKLKKHSNFNKVFNELFDQYKIKDEAEESGYSDWLKSDEDIDNRRTTMQNMNETFERKKKEIKAIVPMKELEDYCYNKGTELTGERPQYYSSDLFSKLQYDDLKKAHVESVIPVTHDDYLQKPKFRNVDEMRRNADYNDTTPMALNQAKEYLKQREMTQHKSDISRAYKLFKQDEIVEQTNKNLMSQFQKLTL